ncbi:MAG: nicotinate (nicotinamide) nucleotide adenylyltransferase [Candidatus Coatesbacteria bacterium]|nr:nicotinate (nicotinamide) nucleotide adenylyltransferase [Candidatus Coatesbacteria bacterium]
MSGETAIFGGTFDPIHYGHLLLAETARDQLELGRIIFVPAARGPHRDRSPRASAADRLAMLELALADNPAFALTELELRRGGLSYTIETVERLGLEQPWLLVGADNLVELEDWHRIGELVRLVRFAYVPRPGVTIDEGVLPPGTRTRALEMPPFGVSSTLLRKHVVAGRSLRYLTPDPVIGYIAESRLYRRG